MFYTWNQHAQQQQTQSFTTEYNQGLSDTSAAFLGQLIEDENTEAIEDIGKRLAKTETVQKLAIYRRNGELIFEQGDSEKAHSEPVISNIAYDNQYNGYLVIYFVPASAHAKSYGKSQQFWLNHNFIWLLGAAVWLSIFVLLNLKRWLKKKPQPAAPSVNPQTKNAQTQTQTQLLKQLIRRSKQQAKTNGATQDNDSLVIQASWEKLNNEQIQQLLRVLNRWLPQNGLFATQFTHGLLVLGLEKEHAPLKRNALYALEQCLRKLQLSPKLILHRLDFGQDIYQTFFQVIEPGIWFEKRLIDVDSHYQWPTQKVLDIEIEESNIIELCQLHEPDAEHRSLLERQVRFLSED